MSPFSRLVLRLVEAGAFRTADQPARHRVVGGRAHLADTGLPELDK